MNDITIRPALPEEIPPALELAQRICREFIRPGPNTAGKYDAKREKLFVAVDGERIVGMASQADGCHIRKLYVDGEYHRRGIATELMDAVMQTIESTRVTVNASAYAMPFYLRYGFTQADEAQDHGAGFITMLMAYERARPLIIAIRPARPEEIRPAIDLALRVFMRYTAPLLKAESVEYFRASCGDEAMLEKYTSGQWRMFAAFDGRKLVGMACERDGVHISKLYVDPAYHRKGIATKLMDALIESMDAPRVTLDSSPYGLPFYTKYGFAPTGEKDPWVPVLTPMVYELP